MGGYKPVELCQIFGRICLILVVIGEHAGGFSDAHDMIAGKQIVDMTAQGGQPGNVLDMRLFVEDRLVQMGNAPALRNVKTEQLA